MYSRVLHLCNGNYACTEGCTEGYCACTQERYASVMAAMHTLVAVTPVLKALMLVLKAITPVLEVTMPALKAATPVLKATMPVLKAVMLVLWGLCIHR